MTYNPRIVAAYWRQCGIPAALPEHKFHPNRRWRFDFAFLPQKVAIEVQGGIWTRGRHTRGAALTREWEKLNTAATLGWRILYCEPRNVATLAFAEQIKEALLSNAN